MPQHAAARALYVRVGTLILVGIGLAVGFVLFLASGELGRQTATYETYIGETVQGLDVGAPVRFRGVAVGRVTEIGLTAAEYRRTDGLPFADAYQLVLVRFALDTARTGGMPSMPEAIRLGLRVRLASQGITGVNYLEIDYVANPERFPPRDVPWQPRYPYIPAMPSTVAQVTSAAEALVARLQQLDLEGLIGNLAGLSADLRGQLARADLARTVAEAQEAAAAAREAIRAAELPETLRAVREAARSVREAGDAAEALVAGPDIRAAVVNTAQATAEMRTALARLPQAIAALEATVRAARVATTDTQAELAPILRDLRVTAQNLRDTTELLRRSPSQALFGAPPPPNPDRR